MAAHRPGGDGGAGGDGGGASTHRRPGRLPAQVVKVSVHIGGPHPRHSLRPHVQAPHQPKQLFGGGGCGGPTYGGLGGGGYL